MQGVSFGEYHSYKDFGLILTKKEISPPEVRKNEIEINGTNGKLDMSEALTGKPVYKNRTLSFAFTMLAPNGKRLAMYSKVMNAIHGKKMEIVLDADPEYFYRGRVSVTKNSDNKGTGELTVTCDVEPYKYELRTSNEPWKWDPFSFVTGIAQVTTFVVNGSKTVKVLNTKEYVCPDFKLSATMIIEFDGIRHTAWAGEYKNYAIVLEEGANNMTFEGNGTVEIIFRGGSL